MTSRQIQNRALRREQVERYLATDMTVKEWRGLNKVIESTMYRWMRRIVFSDTESSGRLGSNMIYKLFCFTRDWRTRWRTSTPTSTKERPWTTSSTGSQYTGTIFARWVRRHGARLSVGRTGSCHDNAVAESFFGSLNNEWYSRFERSWFGHFVGMEAEKT